MNATGSQAIVVATTSGALSVGKDMVLIFRTRKKERKKKKNQTLMAGTYAVPGDLRQTAMQFPI
jgi:hypothetical protein